MKTILAAVDFSDVSGTVVADATALAQACDAQLVLLSVIQPPVILAENAPLIDNLAEIRAAGEKAAARRLAVYEAQIAGHGVKVETVQLYGSPIPLILEQARIAAADFIVMGSHGHTALYDLIVGSTTHGVLQRAPCPIVIVPAKERKPAPSREEQHAIA